jgi:hypothetical protein
MVAGGIIIMPMLMSTVATTMSIRMKGTKMRKPIWKAVRSSLMMKAGMTTRNGMASGVVGGIFDNSTNNSTSLGRVCRSMNDRMGLEAASSAWAEVIFFSM